AKMIAEAHWLAEIPPSLRIYSARLLDSGVSDGRRYYDTEYEYTPTLAELFVFGAVGQPIWTRILASCEEFLSAEAAIRSDGMARHAISKLACDKTLRRLEEYARTDQFDVDAPNRLDERNLPSLRKITNNLIEMISVP